MRHVRQSCSLLLRGQVRFQLRDQTVRAATGGGGGGGDDDDDKRPFL